jgi:hypothetical protein
MGRRCGRGGGHKMHVDSTICRCGNPKPTDEQLCVRCAYYQRVFNPPAPIFESRTERALKAIHDRKLMKGANKVMRIE